MSKSKNKGKLPGIFIFFVCVLAVLALWPGGPQEEKAPAAATDGSYSFAQDSALSVSFIDVGQGDAILLAHDGDYVLIDGGPKEAAQTVLDYCEKAGVDRFDLVIATHPHEDHIGGLDEAITTYGADRVWCQDADYDSEAWEELQTAITAHVDDHYQPLVAEVWTMHGVKISVLGPIGDPASDTNANSIVVRVTHAGDSFLLTGDATKAAERDILAMGYDLKTDVLKLGHHGSSYSSTADFLDAVDPELGIICCGTDNSYGHPHQETLDALTARDVTVYRTDLNGTVVVESAAAGGLSVYTEK